MSRQAKIYWPLVTTAGLLLVAVAVLGGLGVAHNDPRLLSAMMILLLVELAVIVVVMVLRGGLTKAAPALTPGCPVGFMGSEQSRHPAAPLHPTAKGAASTPVVSGGAGGPESDIPRW